MGFIVSSLNRQNVYHTVPCAASCNVDPHYNVWWAYVSKRVAVVSGMHKWETLSELYSVQKLIPNRLTMYQCTNSNCKTSKCRCWKPVQRWKTKKAAILDFKKNVFERASMTIVYVYMVALKEILLLVIY